MKKKNICAFVRILSVRAHFRCSHISSSLSLISFIVIDYEIAEIETRLLFWFLYLWCIIFSICDIYKIFRNQLLCVAVLWLWLWINTTEWPQFTVLNCTYNEKWTVNVSIRKRDAFIASSRQFLSFPIARGFFYFVAMDVAQSIMSYIEWIEWDSQIIIWNVFVWGFCCTNLFMQTKLRFHNCIISISKAFFSTLLNLLVYLLLLLLLLLLLQLPLLHMTPDTEIADSETIEFLHNIRWHHCNGVR